MNSPLQQILVPVDFSLNTDIALQKAMFLSQEKKTTVHLFHVIKVTAFGRLLLQMPGNSEGHSHIPAPNERLAIERLYQLEQKITETGRNITVKCHVRSAGSAEAAIIEMAGDIKADLILIGKNSRHSWFPFLNTVRPGYILQKTNIPVLTFKPGAVNFDFKTIVVPLGQKFPGKKLAAIDAIKSKGLSKIRLLAFKTDETPEHVSKVLFHVYRLLKQATPADIDYTTLSDNNKPRAILNFCRKTEADLLIVSPDTETSAGWMNQQIFDLVRTDAKTQILSV